MAILLAFNKFLTDWNSFNSNRGCRQSFNVVSLKPLPKVRSILNETTLIYMANLYSITLSAPHPGISSNMITLLSVYTFLISFSELLLFTSSDQGMKKVHRGCALSIFTDGNL